MSPEPAIMVSQADVLAQLKVRGFDEGFPQSPLRDFKGKLSSITGTMRKGQRGDYLVVLYNFDQVEVILSIEPYLASITQVEVTQSTREKSRMGYLGTSIDNIINKGVPKDAPAGQFKGQDFLIGKMQRWTMTPGHPIWNQEKKTEVPVECWEVTEVEGFTATTGTSAEVTPKVSGGSSVTEAINLLDGKTEQQWNQAVFANPIIKADSVTVSNILQRQFIPPLLAAGIIVVDGDGIYHVVK